MNKNNIHRLVEKGPNGSRFNLIFDYAIMALIVLNVIALTLETIPKISESIGGFLRQFEFVSVIVFSIEYLIRIYISSLTHPSSSKIKSALKFIFSTYGLIDLLAIIPFYLPLLIKIES